MKQILRCGNYTTTGMAQGISIDILDIDYKKVDNLYIPYASTIFKDGDFTPNFKERVAIEVCKHYDENAEQVIKAVNDMTTLMGKHAKEAKDDAFRYLDYAEEIADLIVVLAEQISITDRWTYNLYKSVKANLSAFTQAPHKMHPEVAKCMGYTQADIEQSRNLYVEDAETSGDAPVKATPKGKKVSKRVEAMAKSARQEA